RAGTPGATRGRNDDGETDRPLRTPRGRGRLLRALRTGTHPAGEAGAGPREAGGEPRDGRRLRQGAALRAHRGDALPRPRHLRRRHEVAGEPRPGRRPDELRQGDRDSALRRLLGSASDYRNIVVERSDGGVGVLRIDRAERRTALNQATLQELATAAREFDRDESVGCIVLTGDERAFAAGADVTEMDGKGVPEMLGAYRFESW